MAVSGRFGIFVLFVLTDAELWRQEVGSDMKIGPADSGYKKLKLRCDEEHMQVDVEMEQDFSGVIYTRGSFHQPDSTCFLDSDGGFRFSLRFPLDECKTIHEDGVYKNIVVIQYDDELIMPGDAAFEVECDFRPRDVTVNTEFAVDGKKVSSRISLADPDPAGKQLPKYRRSTVTNNTGTVAFTPDDVRPRKQKLKDEL